MFKSENTQSFQKGNSNRFKKWVILLLCVVVAFVFVGEVIVRAHKSFYLHDYIQSK